MKGLTLRLIRVFGRLEIEGLDNIPTSGPVILAPNHFHFSDAPLLMAACPRHLEFIGGAQMPDAPFWAGFLPKLWGYIPTNRGGPSRRTLQAALDVLSQDGVLGIYPEGGSWAATVRPARPGVAFLAASSGATVIPVSIIGACELLKKGRSVVKLVFHPAMPQLKTEGRGADRRARLDAWGDQLMQVISTGLPDIQRGRFSNDSSARDYAETVSAWPFEEDGMRGM